MRANWIDSINFTDEERKQVVRNVNYWDNDRLATSQEIIHQKTTAQVNKQLTKYYQNAAKKVIADFEATYNKILADLGDGKTATPADLYKLNKYWEAQAAMRAELRKLGEKEVVALTKAFERNFFDVYYSIAFDGTKPFNTIDTQTVQQMINQIWCADGKSWSERVWGNTEQLAEELNEQLIHCVVAGKNPNELKQLLQERFGVSYNNADMIVRTELAHIQTQAAKQRYEDYGIQRVQVWANSEERRCKVCGKLHQKTFGIHEALPIPAHPRCRCCIVPVVED